LLEINKMPYKSDNFKTVLTNLPIKPGVYRFYSKDDELLYIGKAKKLKNRVSSYFQNGRPHNQRLSLMISQIARIEYTVVSTEKESLILEANLIHELQPKYNIKLKDDKSYLYVRVTNHPIPGIFLTRRKYDPKSQYFGPYTKKTGITNVLRTLRIIFPYCQEKYPKQKPCQYVSIKQCDGICIGQETKTDYLQKIEQIKLVLSGHTDKAIVFLKNKMQQAVSDFNFELAALYRDRIQTLTETVSDQKIVLSQPLDLDLVTLVAENQHNGLWVGSVFVQNIRQGKMINVNNFLLTGSFDLDPEEEKDDNKNSQQQIINHFLQRFFSSFYSNYLENVEVIIQSFIF